ncbi:MAG: hypothetical protein RBT78_09770 [Kiritimatiellia bacterium]|jgi:hypothetical protein|nr:hypothetical protein [Kiritimatiellia bacterium]
MRTSDQGKDLSEYTPWRAARFYIPLLIQTVSQSLTYPLVASIVSHGEHGVVDLAAFAQGQAVMFVIGALGSGLLTTGMVFGRTAEGFRAFRRINFAFCCVLLGVQALTCAHPFDTFVFRGILGLDPAMAKTARAVLLYSIPLHSLFLLRIPGLVVLYNARASAAANWGTLCRIALTACLSPLFVRLGWVGHEMGVLAMTGPVVAEYVLINWMAKPYIRRLGPAAGQPEDSRTQFLFTVPLSFGGVLLALAGFMIGAFITRAAEPARMLPIHYVTIGIVNPVGFAALRMQAVVLAFPPRDRRDRSVFRFALVSGCVLALFPLVGQVPVVAQWYFGEIQNVPACDIPFAMRAMLCMSVLPVVQSLRGHAEGVAAWRKRPNAILAGQAVNLATLVCTLFVTLNFGVPGYLMGVVAILAATLMTWITIRMGLVWAEMEDAFGGSPRTVRGMEG